MSTYYPKVSIVIPAYNASNYLEESINSALEQTYQNIEVIVINDGSNDNGKTSKIAQRYKSRIKYYGKENGGSSSALNYGIREMTGEWFSWLSHDDLYAPNKIEKQVELISSINEKSDLLWKHVVFTACELIDAEGKRIRKSNYSKELKKMNVINSLKDNALLIADQMREFNFHGCGCLVNRKIFETIGDFDENLKLLNDVDMWFRIYSNDFSIHYVPEPLVKGRIHSKQQSSKIRFSYHNAEQDLFWERSLNWLKRYSNEKKSYYELTLFMKVAYEKTRYLEGDKAYSEIVKIKPFVRYKLTIERAYYMIKSRIKSMGKVIYMKYFMTSKG
jgi:hypothetical protein